MTAQLVPRRILAAAAAVLAAAAVWLVHHALSLTELYHGNRDRLAIVYAGMYLLLVWQLCLAYLERPASPDPQAMRILDGLRVACLVPVFNEDPEALRACLRSVFEQQRLPQVVYVVDDGSTQGDYPEVVDWARAAAAKAGVTLEWHRKPNAGKRHAQAVAVAGTPDADVYWTVDSDTISDPQALSELLKPFADSRVMSVAGVVLAANVRRSFLCRFTDLWFVTAQLVDRSALSVLGSVWVNSGPIAAYRADVIRGNLEGYVSETFMGRHVHFSDDSMLTLYAMLRGRTVQQPTAYSFSLMPETVRHHARQFVRWMRGSFIRSLWRMRYLPATSLAFWIHALRWTQTVVSAAVFVCFAVWLPIVGAGWSMAPWLVAVPLVVGYAQTLRYLVVRRSDQSTGYHWRTWLLTPVAVVWSMVVLRALRWYGVATCWATSWGTRTRVEVTLSGADSAMSAVPRNADHPA
ncbi:MAG TPA: glycosyltransferase [Micromonosporaceae bacterium]